MKTGSSSARLWNVSPGPYFAWPDAGTEASAAAVSNVVTVVASKIGRGRKSERTSCSSEASGRTYFSSYVTVSLRRSAASW
ncbi:MAG: hypothetical protein U0835_20710 [Isosphaeraceae bacterium]